MIGFEIHARKRAVSRQTVEKFSGIPVANISDCMSRMAAGGARLRPMHDGRPMAGPALTVRTRPGDNLLVHKALELAQPGDVIVVGSTRAPAVHVEAAGRRWPLRAVGEGWRVDGPPHSRPRFQETVPMSDTDMPDPAGADAPPSAADPTAHGRWSSHRWRMPSWIPTLPRDRHRALPCGQIRRRSWILRA